MLRSKGRLLLVASCLLPLFLSCTEGSKLVDKEAQRTYTLKLDSLDKELKVAGTLLQYDLPYASLLRDSMAFHIQVAKRDSMKWINDPLIKSKLVRYEGMLSNYNRFVDEFPLARFEQESIGRALEIQRSNIQDNLSAEEKDVIYGIGLRIARHKEGSLSLSQSLTSIELDRKRLERELRDLWTNS